LVGETIFIVGLALDAPASIRIWILVAVSGQDVIIYTIKMIKTKYILL
jgi:hypothetical protein